MIAPGAPTLTEKSTPCPGVEVYFPTIDAAAVTITVYRISDGERTPVSGALQASVAGDFVVTDWHVPFGVPAVYVAEIFDIGGASITGAQASITVVRNQVWFQDQVDPELSVAVELGRSTEAWLSKDAGSVISRTRRTTKQFVFGKYRPFLQNLGLGAIEGLPMDVYTKSQAALETMLDLQKVTPIVVRTPPVFASLPRVLFADVAKPQTQPIGQAQGGRRHLWVLQLDEVEPISAAIIRPLVTWADWEAAFPSGTYTWAAVELIYSAGTWTDAVRNPP